MGGSQEWQEGRSVRCGWSVSIVCYRGQARVSFWDPRDPKQRLKLLSVFHPRVLYQWRPALRRTFHIFMKASRWAKGTW